MENRKHYTTVTPSTKEVNPRLAKHPLITDKQLANHELTHWGRVTHICVSKLTIIGSDIGLSPDLCQAIIWTSAGILLIGPLGTNFSEILIEILTFSFKKMRLRVSSAKRRPFCLGLNGLTSLVKEATWEICTKEQNTRQSHKNMFVYLMEDSWLSPFELSCWGWWIIDEIVPWQVIWCDTWWRRQMETFFYALLALCAGNSLVTGEFPTQRPMIQSFDIFVDLDLNTRLSKHS